MTGVILLLLGIPSSTLYDHMHGINNPVAVGYVSKRQVSLLLTQQRLLLRNSKTSKTPTLWSHESRTMATITRPYTPQLKNQRVEAMRVMRGPGREVTVCVCVRACKLAGV